MENSALVVARISQLFMSLFRLFLFLNGGMLMFAVCSLFQAKENWRVMFFNLCMVTLNFWMMLLLFFMVSICLKVCLVMHYSPESLENSSWLQQILFFPFADSVLMVDEEDAVQMAMDASMQEESNRRTPPTLDKLLGTDLKWGYCMTPVISPDASQECLICSNKMDHVFPNIAGCVRLSCTCGTIFHRKCVLEWFHFNETDATDTEPSRVTCPSCRHVFTPVN